jgi:hypothetical protein
MLENEWVVRLDKRVADNLAVLKVALTESTLVYLRVALKVVLLAAELA